MYKFEIGDMVVLKARKVGKRYGGEEKSITLMSFMVFKGPLTVTGITKSGNFELSNYFIYHPLMLKLYTIKG